MNFMELGRTPEEEHHKAALKLHLCFDVLTGRRVSHHRWHGYSAAKAADPLPNQTSLTSLDTLEKLTQDGIYWISRESQLVSV